MNVVRILILLCAVPVGLTAGSQSNDPLNPQDTESPAFPLHDTAHYKVKYLGLTCGHLNLASSIEDFNGRPAYHIIMTVRNSKFFNHIYKIENRIDSWIDGETLSTMVYESVTTEKGKTSRERFEIDRAAGKVHSVENGVEKDIDFDSAESVLDPLAFVFRLQALANSGGDDITLTLMTDKGPVETISTVRGPQSKHTSRGRRQLLEVEPHPVDGKLFSQKGRFSLWIDPHGQVKLYVLDFKLSFGHLIAKID